MDTGIFLSSRRRLLLFGLAPAIFLLIFSLMSSLYINSAYASLRRRLSSVELAPVISEKIKAAQEILKYHEVAASKADIIQMLNEQLEDIAKRSNFSTSLMTVQPKDEKAATTGISIFKINVRGKGSFASVIKFFNETYKFGKLFSVETASMRVADFQAPYTYDADFEFFYHAVCK